ncbi:MAG TPA: hypothetical protein VHC69_10030 [Polyangiaceae bacterium]|nr:hypothetical protein [Polyangiaceae bacterium]
MAFKNAVSTNAEAALYAECLRGTLSKVLDDGEISTYLNQEGVRIYRVGTASTLQDRRISAALAEIFEAPPKFTVSLLRTTGGCESCATEMLTIGNLAPEFLHEGKVRARELWAAIINTFHKGGLDIDSASLETPPQNPRYFAATPWNSVATSKPELTGFVVFDRFEITLTDPYANVHVSGVEPFEAARLSLEYVIRLRRQASTEFETRTGDRLNLTTSVLGIQALTEPTRDREQFAAVLARITRGAEP